MEWVQEEPRDRDTRVATTVTHNNKALVCVVIYVVTTLLHFTSLHCEPDFIDLVMGGVTVIRDKNEGIFTDVTYVCAVLTDCPYSFYFV
jgi:hypothetical protein